jgi:tRNA nucleotidyltransferase (CCA-adding enzyme)
MADYIYMMETRLTPDQQRAVALVGEAARAGEMNVYLTGGAVRDMISGFLIREIDLTVQGNPLKLQRDLEKAGAVVQWIDDDTRTLYLLLPGNVRAEVGMARSERYDKPGKPPEISPGTIIDDLRRRDFTINAMALSLNEGSRGLLLDPANGVADIENKVIRILHNYSFLEEPSRLIRATRFTSRFHWNLEERTQARYDAAKEGNYIERINDRQIGYEIEQLAYEEDPLHIMRALEKEDWLKVLHPRWTVAKVDSSGLGDLLKTREQMQALGYGAIDAGSAAMYMLTGRMPGADISAVQKLIPNKGFVQSWKRLEDEAKELARRLTSKEAATPSLAWKLLSASKPETILFLDTTSRNQSVSQKIKNFLIKWRQVKDKIPLPEMAELHITPEVPKYNELTEQIFFLLLDGKLRSRTETLKFLKPYAPPPPAPPPPPPAKRGRGAKAAEAAPAAAKKGKAAAAAVEEAAPEAKKLPAEKPSKPTKSSHGHAKSKPPKKSKKKKR